MNSLSSIALSGLAAAQLQADVSANNIANQLTPDFRPQGVKQSAVAGGGVQAQVGPSAVPGEDVARDLVNEHMAVYAFKANARVIKTDQSLLGTLLNLEA